MIFRFFMFLNMIFVFVSCGGAYEALDEDISEPTTGVSAPLPEDFMTKAVNSLSKLQAYATLDQSTSQYSLLIDSTSGTLSGQIPNVSAGDHTVEIHMQGRSALGTSWPLSTKDAWVEIATASMNVTTTASGDTTTTLTESQYTYPDDDKDETTNLDELKFGTDPYQPQTLSNVTVGTYSGTNFSGAYSCGQLDYLPHPFRDANIMIQLTDAHALKDTTYLTTQSQWQILANNGSLILELDHNSCNYQNSTVNGNDYYFVFSNGMVCRIETCGPYGIGYGNNFCGLFDYSQAGINSICLNCINNNKTCSDRYDVQ